MKAIITIICASGLLIATQVFSQNTEAESAEASGASNPSSEARQQSETSQPSPAKKSVGKRAPSKEVFKPSEEITEDLPVPFPVDI